MRRSLITPVLFFFALTVTVRADDKMSVKVEKTAPPKELKDGIRDLLDEQAILVLDGNQTLATIWFRKVLPSQAAPEQIKGGLSYREIPETTIVGAVQFPQSWTDYRKQKIAAGVYTLRLAFQPQNGDHMGTAPYNDFCLLSPAAKDGKPDTMEPKELHELSATAAGGTHPSVMLLFPNNKPEDQPNVIAKPNATWVLSVKRPVDAKGMKASLGFGLAVVGQTTQD
jgi:hypothetical protein